MPGSVMFLKLPDIFHRNGLLLDGLGKLLWFDAHRPSHQLWHIIAFQELAVIVGVGARKFERFATLPFVVDMSDEGTSVVAIISPAAEHHPSSIARP